MGRLRAHIFLSGLDSKFDQVRRENLRKYPKLDLMHMLMLRRSTSKSKPWGHFFQYLKARPWWPTRRDKCPYLTPSKNRNNQSFEKSGSIVYSQCSKICYWLPRVVGFKKKTIKEYCRESYGNL